MADIFEDLRRVGIEPPTRGVDQLDLANRLECSLSHLQNLLAGRKPYAGKVKAKLDELIAAKADGPVEVELIVPMLTLTNDLSSMSEPVDLPQLDNYAVIDATGGTTVVSIFPPSRFSNTAARKICDLLNKEAD